VGAADSYCVDPHVLSLPHARSDVGVGATDSYSDDVLQVVRFEHTRSEFAVGATDWNFPSWTEHTV
jgi:hypothetical protein